MKCMDCGIEFTTNRNNKIFCGRKEDRTGCAWKRHLEAIARGQVRFKQRNPDYFKNYWKDFGWKYE